MTRPQERPFNTTVLHVWPYEWQREVPQNDVYKGAGQRVTEGLTVPPHGKK
jgi:hypothetical protein